MGDFPGDSGPGRQGQEIFGFKQWAYSLSVKNKLVILLFNALAFKKVI